MNDQNAAPNNDGPEEGEERPDVSVRMIIKANSPVEAAAEILCGMKLCPRDMFTLGASLICATVETANTNDLSPFHHISTKLEMDKEGGNSPFHIAIAALQEVISWGNYGEDVPTSALKPRPGSDIDPEQLAAAVAFVEKERPQADTGTFRKPAKRI